MEINEAQYLPWVDIETFGLDPENDPIIELGIRVTDLNLNVIDSQSWLVWSPGHFKRYEELVKTAHKGNEGSRYVLDMHTENKLFTDAKSRGVLPHQAEDGAVQWLETKGFTKLPMCGSSVDFDRKFILAQMPRLAQAFHYRVIDNSTLKELCRRYNPELFAKAPEAKYVAPNHHRVSLCLEDTIAEFRFYRDEFLLW